MVYWWASPWLRLYPIFRYVPAKNVTRRNTMDFGITVATAADSWRVVKRAEELGFTYAWFYDTQMLNADPFVAMAAAAVHTRTIHLGTGVLVPSIAWRRSQQTASLP